MIRLVAFLGNYGSEYEGTRHNAAWLFADSLDFAGGLSWQEKFQGVCASAPTERFARDGGSKIYFLKPMTYMNLSGQSVASAMRFFKIGAGELLVVHDELELPLGAISLKWSGGLGGHNGLRSIKASTGTADFWRLRFGIGRPEHDDVAGYVLSPFSCAERATFEGVFAQGRECLSRALLSEDPKTLLAEWGKRSCEA